MLIPTKGYRLILDSVLFRRLTLFSILLVLAFLIFRNGRVEIPRAEQYYLMGERTFAENEWDYFINLLSITRTQVLNKGNFELWRPLPMAVLALQDIFFRPNLFVTGALSILLHTTITFSLFLVLELLVPWLIALMLSIVFLTQYMGMEIILWRHSNPFSLNVFFLAIAFYALLRTKDPFNKKTLVLATTGLTLSSFCMETITLPLAAFVIWISIPIPWHKANPNDVIEPKHSTRRWLFFLCLVPFITYWTLDVLNWFHYMGHTRVPPYLETKFDESYLTTLFNFFSVLGVFGLGFLMPQLFDLSTVIRFGIDRIARREGNSTLLQSIPHWLPCAIGAILFITFVYGIFFFRKNRGKTDLKGFIFFHCGLSLILISANLAYYRLRGQGLLYMDWATNYFYYSNFFFITLLALALHEWHSNQNTRSRSRAVTFTILLIGILQVGFGYLGIQKVAAPVAPLAQYVSKIVLELSKRMEKYPDHCYADGIDSGAYYSIPKILLQRQSCALKPKKPLYSYYSPDKTLHLVELLHPKEEPSFSLDSSSGRWNQNKEEGATILRGTGFLWGTKVYEKPISFEATVHNPRSAGIIVAHRENGEFFLFGIEGGKAIMRRRKENKNQTLPIDYTLPTQTKIRLAYLAISPTLSYFYVNDQIVKVLLNYGSFEGTVGLYSGESDVARPQYFSNVLVEKDHLALDSQYMKILETFSIPYYDLKS